MTDYQYMDSLYLDEFIHLTETDFVSDRQLGSVSVSDAVIVPFSKKWSGAGVLDSNNEYVAYSAFDTLIPSDGYNGISGLKEPVIDRQMDGTLFFLGRLRKHWGHFLMDSLSRLWYYKKHHLDSDIVYIGDQLPKGGSMEEFFRLLEIDPTKLIHIDTVTRCERLIIAEPSFIPGRYITKEFSRLFSDLADRINEDAGPMMEKKEKVYLTRTQLKSYGTHDFGEGDIEKAFEINGFSIVAPEKLSLKEQIRLLSNAETIACISGTLPHTLVFARDKTKAIIIKKSFKQNYRQVAVNQIKDFDVSYIDAHVSLAPIDAYGPFLLKLNSNMIRFLQDHAMRLPDRYGKDDFSNLLKYLRVLRQRNREAIKNTGKPMQSTMFSDHGQFDKAATRSELTRYYLFR